jgi:hypothetical protein
LANLPNIEFNQRHIYKNTDSIPDSLRSHTKETGKPYVIGEYSYEWDWTKDFKSFAPQMDADFKNGLWLGLFSPTPVLPMTWWWEFFDERKLTTYFARVRTMHDMMLAAGGGDYLETTVSWRGPTLRHVLAVKCGSTRFVFLGNRDANDAAGTLMLAGSDTARSVRLYDPQSDQFTERPSRPIPFQSIEDVTVPANGNLILVLADD